MRYHGACFGALLVYWLVVNGLATLVDTPYVVGFVLGTGRGVRVEPDQQLPLGVGRAVELTVQA